jgi:hypothetical protein
MVHFEHKIDFLLLLLLPPTRRRQERTSVRLLRPVRSWVARLQRKRDSSRIGATLSRWLEKCFTPPSMRVRLYFRVNTTMVKTQRPPNSTQTYASAFAPAPDSVSPCPSARACRRYLWTSDLANCYLAVVEVEREKFQRSTNVKLNIRTVVLHCSFLHATAKLPRNSTRIWGIRFDSKRGVVKSEQTKIHKRLIN